MNTFLPTSSFYDSARILDYRRLGKQRVECKQILNVLAKVKEDPKAKIGWRNHPAVLMWEGFEECLKYYTNTMIQEWIARGYNNTMELYDVDYANLIEPFWLGDDRVHSSHRSNLLRKDYSHYGAFEWTESDDLEYYWPVKVGMI